MSLMYLHVDECHVSLILIHIVPYILRGLELMFSAVVYLGGLLGHGPLCQKHHRKNLENLV